MALDVDLRRLIMAGPWVATDSDVVARELIRRTDAMWDRSRYDPGHFTASGFVASPDGRSMLLIEHARLGRWLQPGGHFEPGDTSVDAAVRREVDEETGIGGLQQLTPQLFRIDAHPIPARRDEPPHVHVDLGMAYQAVSWTIGPIEEVLDARWVPFGDLDTIDADDAVRSGADALGRLVT